MYHDEEQTKKESDTEFEVAFEKPKKRSKDPMKSEQNRMSQEHSKQKKDVFKQCSGMYKYLKQLQIKQNEVIIQLPEQLQAKYIIKSITYLADEWLTLKTTFIKIGDSQHKIVIDLDQIEEEQIANLCAELNECIDHFIARTVE